MKTILILLASTSILSAEYDGDCDRDWGHGRNGIQRQLEDARIESERSDNERARREAREHAEQAARDRQEIKEQLEQIQRDARREKQQREMDEALDHYKIPR